MLATTFFSIFFFSFKYKHWGGKRSVHASDAYLRDGQIQFSLKTGQLLDGFIHNLNMNICSLIWTADNVVVGL